MREYWREGGHSIANVAAVCNSCLCREWSPQEIEPLLCPRMRESAQSTSQHRRRDRAGIGYDRRASRARINEESPPPLIDKNC